MFLHNLKYEVLHIIRGKEIIGWMLVFPIILATFFYLAFGNLYEKETAFSTIDVAVVENTQDETFTSVMNELSAGDSPLFKAVYTDKNKAHKLMSEGDVLAVIYVDSELSMAAMTNSGLSQTIVKSFIEQYNTRNAIITEAAVNNPEKLPDVINALSSEIDCTETKTLSSGNMDPYVAYVFNLIAMVALFASGSGVFAATENQGNLSAIGARKCVSPTHKMKSTATSLIASFFGQAICTFVSITYILFVLKFDMGDKIFMIYLSGIIGCLAGTSLGFFVGSVGTASENTKFGIAFAITMVSCFLSGLMVGNMKLLINRHCPIVNKLNPAALISDMFYCLSIYDDYKRYGVIVATLLTMSVIFTVGGFLLTRRKKYASI